MSYFDNSVEVAASKEQKTLTDRQTQQIMESALSIWDNEDSSLFTKPSAAPSELSGCSGAPAEPSSSGIGGGHPFGNRKGNARKKSGVGSSEEAKRQVQEEHCEAVK